MPKWHKLRWTDSTAVHSMLEATTFLSSHDDAHRNSPLTPAGKSINIHIIPISDNQWKWLSALPFDRGKLFAPASSTVPAKYRQRWFSKRTLLIVALLILVFCFRNSSRLHPLFFSVTSKFVWIIHQVEEIPFKFE
ncbi:hypothetical protein NE237_001875 [Protea cynaroides]|uniref:Uncharacterized protein n=1 Tax=Protea cynaroides TaxID=273540 RepID=A0A9Q0QYU9_9MAGN|nr:hypothetical protein NE237_001875 [Protea cynaroides]